MTKPRQEKYLRKLFDAGIILKLIDGLVQTAAGLAFWLAGPAAINRLLRGLTATELAEDPSDFVANSLIRLGHIPATSGSFVVLFLLSHGITKIFIATNLLKNRLWAYPLGLILFTGFGVYQTVAYWRTPTLTISVLTILDFLVVALTWHEYRLVRSSSLRSLGVEDRRHES